MKRVRVAWRDDTFTENDVRDISKDRNGDFTVWEADGSVVYIPSSAVYSIKVKEVGDK